MISVTDIGASLGLVLGILTAIGIRTVWPAIPAMRAAKLDPVVA